MKLRNRKTGEIANLEGKGLLKSDNNNHIIVYPDGTLKYYAYNSLAELNEEWEDEPEGFWSINGDATIEHFDRLNENDHCKEIGNYFETREEAEKAVEKLKAWKRLKDKGFEFTGFSNESIGYEIKELSGDFALDLDLLFNGGEE